LEVCLLFALTLFTRVVVRAQEDVEVGDDDLQTQPEHSSDAYDGDGISGDVSADVSTTYFLPTFSDKRFPIGKPITFLVNFVNSGAEVLNISTVRAFLHSPFDLNYYIQNFSAWEVRGGMVGPKSQMSLDYQFMTDPTLEPLEYWLSGYVEYQAEGSDTVYRGLYFNETVTLFTTSSSGDLTIILSTLVLLGGLVFGIYVLMKNTKKGKTAKKKLNPKPVLTEAEKADVEKSWEMPIHQRASGKGPKKIRK